MSASNTAEPITIQPLDLSHLWVFEELHHPIGGAGDRSIASLTPGEIISALYVLSDSRKAFAALQKSRDAFNVEVFKFAERLTQNELASLTREMIADMIAFAEENKRAGKEAAEKPEPPKKLRPYQADAAHGTGIGEMPVEPPTRKRRKE